MKAEANGNLVSDLAMPNRILSYLIFVVTKIAKDEYRKKRTRLFFVPDCILFSCSRQGYVGSVDN